MKQLILANPKHINKLVTDHPDLKSVAPFSGLPELKLKGCNCNHSDKLKEYQDRFSSLVSSVSDNDKKRILEILKIDRVCFYTRVGNDLKMTCYPQKRVDSSPKTG